MHLKILFKTCAHAGYSYGCCLSSSNLLIKIAISHPYEIKTL